LAVRIAAARLRTDRSRTVTGAGLLAQLRTELQADRLAALTEGDRGSVRTGHDPSEGVLRARRA
jgi:hypothetical protein